MKDFDVESKEWWEVVEEYFAKDLEKNLTQHRIDERSLMYKLEIYQKKILDFVYESSTSTKTLGQDEGIEVRPSGTTQEEKVQTKEPQELKGNARKKKDHKQLKNKNRQRLLQQQRQNDKK